MEGPARGSKAGAQPVRCTSGDFTRAGGNSKKTPAAVVSASAYAERKVAGVPGMG